MTNGFGSIIDQMHKQKIMIIGDMVADVYLEGKISRISREAPVLILEHAGETVVPGGAANAVHNAATLDAEVWAVGVIGSDTAGVALVDILKGKDVNTAGLVADGDRPTITKMRVMAGGQSTVRQQIVRIDRENKEALSEATENLLLNYIIDAIGKMDVIVMSDYGSGTITNRIIAEVIRLCRQYRKPCIVDSRYQVMQFTGVTLVKQNESEAAAAIGFPINDNISLVNAGTKMLEALQAEAVLITRGPDGMSLFEKNGAITHIPVTNKSEVYDVTGAGDTVVVAFMLAIAAGAGYAEAARIANFAAGIVVRKPGTATTTVKELKEAVGADCENN